MELVLMRHGIAADRGDPAYPHDADRPLTLEGKHRTDAAARGLRTLIERPDRILSSPYVRCRQTARAVLEAFGLRKAVLTTSEALVPEAAPEAIWAELAAHPDERIIVVGHGGTLEPIAGFALGQPAEPIVHLRKAGALCLAVAFEPTLTAGLEWLVTPKILRQLGR